jgi:magnesium-dependent phosphatase 1
MLLVFDLDFTLWDAGGTWCDHTDPPYTKVNGHIRDALGRQIHLYPDVRTILETLSGKHIPMAVASRTHSPGTAHRLMDLFGIRDFFSYEEIYPGSKLVHFRSLQKRTGISYGKMVFFDDEHRNIAEVGRLGVKAIPVHSGLNWADIQTII